MALSFSDIKKAAEQIGVEPCTVKAIVEVESGGSGFSPDSRIMIQYEGHVMWRELKKRGIDPHKHLEEHHDCPAGVLYPKFDKSYVLRQSAEYRQLEHALAIHEEAALLSTSWGLFQIMGFNHRACGFATVQDFVDAQKESEANQLYTFCAFMRSEGLLLFLKGLDWAGFARRYNGPGYAQNQYDVKLRKAYERCKSTL